jgi:D-alanyl-D-alanine carboxypeptidase
MNGLTVSRRALLAAGLAASLPAPLLALDAAAVDKAVGDAVTALMKGAKTPGVSAAVIHEGRLVTAVAGMADPERRLRMTPATRLMGGSTGKTFAAVTALKLVEEGRLALDAPIAPLFADTAWYKRLPNAEALTLRMLLMHTGGFPQFLDVPDFMARYLWDSMRGRSTAYSPEQMLALILDREPLNAPGKAHHYSDLHYHLAGLVMERATGRDYYDLLQEKVLDPLGLADVIPANRKALSGLAAGYARGDILAAFAGQTGRTLGEDGALRNDPSLEWTGGGLALTPRALARFYEALGAGRLLKPETLALMQTSSLPLPTGPGVKARYGLGVFVTEREGFGRYISHSGFFPGYTSNVAHFLDHGLTVAVQFNTDSGPDVNEALRSIAAAAIGLKT